MNDVSVRYLLTAAAGHAPVVDACGMAGGKGPKQKIGGASNFKTTVLASMGDLGSVTLKPSANRTKWARGTSVEVAWGIRFNHGAPPAAACCRPPPPFVTLSDC